MDTTKQRIQYAGYLLFGFLCAFVFTTFALDLYDLLRAVQIELNTRSIVFVSIDAQSKTPAD